MQPSPAGPDVPELGRAKGRQLIPKLIADVNFEDGVVSKGA